MVRVIQLINAGFQVYTLMIFARILCSWLPQLNDYRVVQFISYYTDPYLNFFRRFVPPLGMIDFSPIIAFLFLSFLKSVIFHLLIFFA